MRLYNLLSITLLIIVVASCGGNSIADKDLFSIEINSGKNIYSNSDTLLVSLKNNKNIIVESIIYTLNDAEVGASSTINEVSIPLSNQKLGKRTLLATISADGDTYTSTKEITIISSVKPTLYTYKILKSYPHDIDAYTQGLEFFNDTLYESTGQYKSSSLRKTNYKTGEIYQNIPLPNQYFGEGITILNNKIYQLTWKENTGFIYDLESMEKKGTFVYGKSVEGWGLCNNGTSIFKSDGTEKIWTLHPETLAEESAIEIYTNTSKIKSVNELEWVDGKIYANIYERDAIAIVDPKSGAVEGVINLKGLKDKVTQHKSLNVLNGIAYKGEPNIIYVTGKQWDRLFKLEIIEK